MERDERTNEEEQQQEGRGGEREGGIINEGTTRYDSSIHDRPI